MANLQEALISIPKFAVDRGVASAAGRQRYRDRQRQFDGIVQMGHCN